MILFVHVPKTAGMHFKRVLLAVYSRDELVDDNDDHPELPGSKCHTDPVGWRRDAAAFVRNLQPSAKMIFGHFSAAKYVNLLPNAQWMAWVRHPVKRLVSNYYFLKTIPTAAYPNHVLLEAVQRGIGFEEFAEIPMMQNLVTQVYLRTLRLDDFAFVGLQEFFAEDLEELQQLLRWPRVQVAAEPTNVNPHPGYAEEVRAILADREIVRRVERMNRDDLDFYAEALERRQKRRAGFAHRSPSAA